MADPIIQPAETPAITASTATQGLADPNFAKALDAAFAKVRGTPAPEPDIHADTPDTTPPPAPKPDAPKPQAAPAPAPEPEPELDKEPTTSTAKANWKELKRLKAEAEAAAEAAKTRAKELETRLAKYNDEEIQRTKAERDEFEKHLRAFAIEHDPKFQKEYEQGIERIGREAQMTLGDRAKRFMSLLGLPEGDFKRAQLADLTQDLDDFAKQDVYGLMRDHRKLATDRQLVLENAKQNYEKMVAMERQRMQDQQRQVLAEFDNTLAEWQGENGIPALRPRPGDDAHNSSVREAVQRARDIFTGSLTQNEMIKAALWSAAAPNLLKGLDSIMSENQKLKQEIAALKVAEPDLGGGGTTEVPGVDEDASFKAMSYGEKMAYLAAKNGGFDGR